MWTRYLSTAPAGIAMTVALLYSMQALIASGEAAYVEPREPVDITFHKVREASEVQQIDPAPERLPPPAPVPSLTPPETESAGGGVSIQSASAPATPSGVGITLAPILSDGPLVAIVRVAPEYPVGLSARGIEGYATVRFDVRADGSVDNIRLLDASHPAFARPAMRAAERFRYKPRVVDGTAVATQGLDFRFRFSLE